MSGSSSKVFIHLLFTIHMDLLYPRELALFRPVLRIRIRRIHVFGPPGSGPDPLVRGMDPDPDPSIIKQK